MGRVTTALAILGLASSCAWTSTPKAETKASLVKTSTYEAAGERVLRHELTLNAPVEEVWHSFTTSDGLRTWAAPVVEFELKTGGKFHSNYRLSGHVGDPGTIYNTVLSYLPMKMLSFKIALTEQFPAGPREAGTLVAIAQLEPLGKRRTKLVLSMVGFGNGPDWDKVFNSFAAKNPDALSNLQQSLEKGPIDWKQLEMASAAAK